TEIVFQENEDFGMNAPVKNNSKTFWDERYASSGDSFLFGKEPSTFLMNHLGLLGPRSKILDLGSGEGRNAVAMALKEHSVTAIDYSEVASARAEALAKDSR